KRFNVVFEAGADSYIVPAPLLEGKLFEQSSRRDVQLQAIHAFTAFKPVKCSELQGYSLPPSREILEGLVARILGGFGFKVYVNVKLPNKAGGETEADAWAVRGDFRVYVSCKNWSSSVGRGVVEEEFGRVYNLREVPQLKVLVVGNMSDEARRTALADGFYVVELGTKAQAGNLEEVCETVQDGLMKIFTSIALPQLSQAYKLLGEIKAKVEELRKLEMLIEDLKRTLSESAVS
ncbi:MAG: restriction endonuclease, partial [Desulfurococcaceae archaeon]